MAWGDGVEQGLLSNKASRKTSNPTPTPTLALEQGLAQDIQPYP